MNDTKNPFTTYRHLLEEICLHYSPNQHPNAILVPLRRYYMEKYPNSAALLAEYCEALASIEWKHLPASAVLEPLSRMPSLGVDRQDVFTLDGYFPLSLAYQVSTASPPLAVRAEPDGASFGSCDLFAWPRSVPHMFYAAISHRKSPDGKAQTGIAIECKAVASVQKIKRRMKESSQQLTRYGAGFTALDVSLVVQREASAWSSLEYEDLWKLAASRHQAMHDEALTELNRLSRLKRHGSAMLMTHCQLFSAARRLEGFSGVQVMSYRRTLCDPVEGSHMLGIVPGAFVEFARAIAWERSYLHILPTQDKSFHIPPGGCLLGELREGGTTLELPNEPNSSKDGLIISGIRVVYLGGPISALTKGFRIDAPLGGEDNVLAMSTFPTGNGQGKHSQLDAVSSVSEVGPSWNG